MTNVDAWVAALEQRHLANLTRSELTRALRALSSCYVERREKLAAGAALEGHGKRAAFALFYGPLHFLTVTALVRALLAHEIAIDVIVDLGCGTGVGGAAWALACATPPAVVGIDRNAWAVQEANWTYKTLGVSGRA
jgi:predicted O-methyltransferase YrrM